MPVEALPKARGFPVHPRVTRRRLLASSLVLLALMVLWGLFIGGRLRADMVISESMEPTLRVGDRLIVRECVECKPARGEIVVIEAPDGFGPNMVKRVAGIPGDMVVVINQFAFINHKPSRADLEVRGAWPPKSVRGYMLGEDEYFVLGDNRDNSWDSVYFGPIDGGSIVGKPVLRYAPLSYAGLLR